MIKEGEMLSDLMSLFAKKDDMQSEAEQKATDMTIKMSHAFAWYDGDPMEDEERWRIFSDKVDALIQKCHENGWHKQPDILSEKWVDGVLEIDECHQEDQPLKDGLEQLDWEDLTRHWLNGGSRFGISKNIHGQINKIVKKNNKRAKQEYYEIMSRAKKRYSEG